MVYDWPVRRWPFTPRVIGVRGPCAYGSRDRQEGRAYDLRFCVRVCPGGGGARGSFFSCDSYEMIVDSAPLYVDLEQ